MTKREYAVFDINRTREWAKLAAYSALEALMTCETVEEKQTARAAIKSALLAADNLEAALKRFDELANQDYESTLRKRSIGVVRFLRKMADDAHDFLDKT